AARQAAAGPTKELLSNRSVQRELISANTVDFATDRPLEETESLPQIKLEPSVSQPGAAPPANAEEAKVARKSGGTKRNELRQQTQSQSAELNSALGAPVAGDQLKDISRKGSGGAGLEKSAIQELDADQVLELSGKGAVSGSDTRPRYG